MVTKSKALIAQQAQAGGIQRQRHSEEQFCFRQDISPGYLRSLKAKGKGPKLDADGKVTLEAEADWMKQRAAEAEAEANAKESA
jgi:hypothetical protein